MYEVEIFPLGIEGVIVLSLGAEQLNWGNITASVNFTYTLSENQDTYQHQENSTYYQVIDGSRPAGRNIENDEFGELAVDHLIWDSSDRVFILNDDLRAENPLNVTILGSHIISSNVTTYNINRLSLTTQGIISDGYGRVSYTEDYQGSVVVQSLGNDLIPIYDLSVGATNVILLGRSQVYNANIEAFNAANETQAMFFNQSLCSIDASYILEGTIIDPIPEQNKPDIETFPANNEQKIDIETFPDGSEIDLDNDLVTPIPDDIGATIHYSEVDDKVNDAIKPIIQEPINNVPKNVVAGEAQKTELRAAMEKPFVHDEKLYDIIESIYKEGSDIGSGSTAAAVRQESITGNPVKGKMHSQKANDKIRELEKWLRKNLEARPGDKAAAENIILDLRNTLQ